MRSSQGTCFLRRSLKDHMSRRSTMTSRWREEMVLRSQFLGGKNGESVDESRHENFFEAEYSW